MQRYNLYLDNVRSGIPGSDPFLIPGVKIVIKNKSKGLKVQLTYLDIKL